MADFRTIIKHGYEEVALWRDQGAGIEAICAIHSTALGPAIGGLAGSRTQTLTPPSPMSCACQKR